MLWDYSSAMKKILIVFVLAVIIGIAGCVQEEKKEAPVEEKNISGEIIAENTTEEASPEPESPIVLDEKVVGHGRSSSLVSNGGTLYIAYQRYTGNEDIYYATYKNGSISKPAVAIKEVIDEITPSLVIFGGKVYLFYTKSSGGLSSNVPFKIFEGEEWSRENDGPDIYEIWYPHNQSALYHKNKILLFWSKGRANERGNIGAQYYDGSHWIDGIKVSAENIDERNPKVNSTNSGIHLLFEGYAPNGESSEVYYRYHDGFEWSSAKKISGSVDDSFKSSGAVIERDGKILAFWFAKGRIYLSIKEGGEWKDPVLLISENTVQEPAIAEQDEKLFISYTKWAGNVPYVYLAELKGA